ncbi:hypothetical protein BDQ17DRAFT_1336817 [Cyathus striatus]|nr:hypothetical protein BDQ17DRAFT_1336817 [Cyathus striatus]
MTEESDKTIQHQGTPPLRSLNPGPNGKPIFPYYVFEYAPTNEDLLTYAKKHNILQDEEEYYQKNEAHLIMCDGLPDKLSLRLVTSVICHVVGTNANAKEMEFTKNEDIIALFKEAFETDEEPRRQYQNRVSVKYRIKNVLDIRRAFPRGKSRLTPRVLRSPS